jgi:hypothetical protein
VPSCGRSPKGQDSIRPGLLAHFAARFIDRNRAKGISIMIDAHPLTQSSQRASHRVISFFPDRLGVARSTEIPNGPFESGDYRSLRRARKFIGL